MIACHDALTVILEQSHRLASTRCPSSQTLGRGLAQAVISPADLPPFDNTAMDGFALCAGVRIRPGKPLLFARLPGGALCFGLPGNPVSGAVGIRFFVEPALRRMLGLPPEQALRLPLRQKHPAALLSPR